ncbi:MAG TPA: hypothetical protein VNM92_13840 [Thermoanaerobaculia bacterium]|nr:hypothetical protein [Thermoanaerobaculia bacterium]
MFPPRGSNLCLHHDPARAHEIKPRAIKGGKARGRQIAKQAEANEILAGKSGAELMTSETQEDLCRVVLNVMTEVKSGKLDPRRGNTIILGAQFISRQIAGDGSGDGSDEAGLAFLTRGLTLVVPGAIVSPRASNQGISDIEQESEHERSIIDITPGTRDE